MDRVDGNPSIHCFFRNDAAASQPKQDFVRGGIKYALI